LSIRSGDLGEGVYAVAIALEAAPWHRPRVLHGQHRRAGFGATRAELDALAGRSYESVVEELLHPEEQPEIDEDILRRYFPGLVHQDSPGTWNARWIYRMINSRRPLEEKLTLFWHGLFATGWDKSEHTPSSISQIELFRRNALAPLRTILLELSKDPAMIYWLANSDYHRAAQNEIYGRALMQPFIAGTGPWRFYFADHDVAPTGASVPVTGE